MFTRFLIPGLALLLTLGLGVWLSQLGRPYNGLLFNVHKLMALGAVVAGGWVVSRLLNGMPLGAPALLVLGGAAVLVVILFAGGALLSMNKFDYTLTLNAHRVAALALAAALVAAAWILEGVR